MPNLKNLDSTTGADIIGSEATPVLTIQNTLTGSGLKVVGGSTVTSGAIAIVASAASQAFFSFSGVFISSASYSPGTTNAFVIPVYHTTQAIWGYIGAQKALV